MDQRRELEGRYWQCASSVPRAGHSWIFVSYLQVLSVGSTDLLLRHVHIICVATLAASLLAQAKDTAKM